MIIPRLPFHSCVRGELQTVIYVQEIGATRIQQSDQHGKTSLIVLYHGFLCLLFSSLLVMPHEQLLMRRRQ